MIRMAVSALHTTEMLDRFGDALKKAVKKADFWPTARERTTPARELPVVVGK